ncbi:MAG: tRNA 4-thiouridine(8) synthase ThiI [Bacilli bacterium]|nr:tRNA 4-thiouridine(8) synthase ThiI [Bacilli bacterium]
MEKIVIIKYGELTLKKKNKNYFLKSLRDNVAQALSHINHEIYYDYGRMFIYVEETLLEATVEVLKKVFGIYEIIIGYKTDNREIENFSKEVLKLVQEKSFHTFKVATKRSDKTYPTTSMELNQIIATEILKNIPNLKVDLHQPELVVNVEIRKNEVLFYFDGIKALGGYPVGTLGKGLLMLSGGIDSPVAGYMAIKRGVKIEAIYFESPPHTSEQAKNKVILLAKKLAAYNGNVKLHVINFTEIQETILKNIPREYLITIMRRMMYRISAIIAANSKASILVNGESIGQVASQTLTSMRAINEVVRIPVIRPLACFDKTEIMDIARKIDTYDISTLPYEDCCTIFVPEHPVINPVIEKCNEYEELIPYQDLIYKAIHHHEIIKVTCEEEHKEEYKDLL